MRKLLYILFCLSLFCSCSAEKRLAHLLAHHPELHKDSVHVVDTFYVQKADTATTTFTIDQLKQLLAQKKPSALDNDTTPSNANNSKPSGKSPISAESKGSKALITPNADGSFSLQSITKQDTIYIHDSIPIPIYYTDTKEKIVYKMNNVQSFFFGLGILALVLFIILIGIRIARTFI